MDNKEKVLTLASAARKVGMDPEELRELIYEGKLDAVETEEVDTDVDDGGGVA